MEIESHLRMNYERKAWGSLGLKPMFFGDSSGTDEAVPFPKTSMSWCRILLLSLAMLEEKDAPYENRKRRN